MAQVDWLWMDEDELRAVCTALVNLLRQSEGRVAWMAQNMERAIEYGYGQGYTDGTLQLPYAPQERDAAGVVLH